MLQFLFDIIDNIVFGFTHNLSIAGLINTYWFLFFIEFPRYYLLEFVITIYYKLTYKRRQRRQQEARMKLFLENPLITILAPIGKELLDNRKMFLSKRALYSFGGYATAQLRRLDNKSMRTLEQAQQEQHILNSVTTASYAWPEKYQCFGDDDFVNLYLDASEQEDMDKEIFMDIHLTHYPLVDHYGIYSEMNQVIKDYNKAFEYFEILFEVFVC